MARGKQLLCKYEDMSWNPQHPCKKLGAVLCTHNYSTGEAKTGRPLKLVGQPMQPKRLCLKTEGLTNTGRLPYAQKHICVCACAYTDTTGKDDRSPQQL